MHEDCSLARGTILSWQFIERYVPRARTGIVPVQGNLKAGTWTQTQASWDAWQYLVS